MSEYAFELALCARLEDGERIVSRQLGGAVRAPGNRILDVVCVEPGPEFSDRAAITPETIPPLAIEAGIGVGRARDPHGLIDAHPEFAREAVDEAVDVGFFERERRDGRDLVRQTARYPDWFGAITAIENKPDLAAPGDLERQLRTDVSLGLVDRVILATESYVTRAHLNRLPEEVGVWRVQGGIEVIREPTRLTPAEPGIEILDREPLRTDVAVVSASEKAKKRRRIGERAYGKGWRPALPACANVGVGSVAGSGGLPHCTYYDEVVNPAGCGPDCPGYEEGAVPEFDAAAEREANSPWVAEPDGRVRRQVGLDRFSG
ncbi:DUF5787 family protein [Natronorarus salvus]|uniref:DUF5787 family protein n=1 Tax=Natronorarus salvus TaxID=3117733 RepID=UPI002F26196F